jgi:uncharacterized protein YlxW (UPF0749 family)
MTSPPKPPRNPAPVDPDPPDSATPDAATPEATPRDTQADSRRRLLASAQPRLTRGKVLGGLLCALLGFAVVAQVRSTQEAGLDTLRQSDLIGILNDVSERSARLQAEVQELEATREELTSGTDSSEAALEQFRHRANTLGILAGILPAQGTGIELRISDPTDRIDARILLDTVQELRGAGAEALSINGLRVVASTAFVDLADGGIAVDGTGVSPPYTFLVIGDPTTLQTSLEIPGGAVDTIEGADGTADAQITELDTVHINSTVPAPAPDTARPAEDPPGG